MISRRKNSYFIVLFPVDAVYLKLLREKKVISGTITFISLCLFFIFRLSKVNKRHLLFLKVSTVKFGYSFFKVQ